MAGRQYPLLLLICSDDDLLGLLAAVAGENGYKTRTASAGAEAIRIARALHPDLVVLFSKLADMHSQAVVQRLRADADPTTASQRLLLLDYEISEPNLWGAFQSGVDDVFRLPGSLADLLRCWRNMLILPHRPSPLAALLNSDEVIARTALSFLLHARPPGLATGLTELQVAPDPTARARAAWALERLGKLESRSGPVSRTDAQGRVVIVAGHGK